MHSGGALITVMKSADLRDRNDAPALWRLHFARMGAVVMEGLMRAGGVVVREIVLRQNLGRRQVVDLSALIRTQSQRE
ncbi:MAG: hypothetical protein DMF98_25655 [Acidobacteria bacterium]|nr:MAG: hypothetical protein DMF98_25655 [Acidobacteriota bacterium]